MRVFVLLHPLRIKGQAIFRSRPSTVVGPPTKNFCRPSSFFRDLPNVFHLKHQKIVARPFIYSIIKKLECSQISKFLSFKWYEDRRPKHKFCGPNLKKNGVHYFYLGNLTGELLQIVPMTCNIARWFDNVGCISQWARPACKIGHLHHNHTHLLRQYDDIIGRFIPSSNLCKNVRNPKKLTKKFLRRKIIKKSF